MKLVIVTTEMIPEATVGVLAVYLAGNRIAHSITPAKERNVPGILKKKVEEAAARSPISKVIILGDFWLKSAPEFYCEVETLLFDSNVVREGLLSVLAHITNEPETAAQLQSRIPRAFKCMSDRLLGRNASSSQLFSSGLMNAPQYHGSGLERLKQFLEDGDPEAESSILNIGELIVKGQMTLVEERVKNDFCHSMLKGHHVAVTAGSEFINLTHDELHAQYPGASFTCVMKTWASSKEIQYSLRSWMGINLLTIVEPLGGGGKSDAAAVRLPLNVQFFD